MYTLIKHYIKLFVIPVIFLGINDLQAQEIPDNSIKKNVAPISSPLQSVLKLEPRVFEYDTDIAKPFKFKAGKQYGFLADNVQEVFPTMVSSRTYPYIFGKNAYRNARVQVIDEVSLIPVLVASIQELNHEINQLKAEIKELKK